MVTDIIDAIIVTYHVIRVTQILMRFGVTVVDTEMLVSANQYHLIVINILPLSGCLRHGMFYPIISIVRTFVAIPIILFSFPFWIYHVFVL